MDEGAALARARLVAPVLLLDGAEPFRPFLVGVRVVDRPVEPDCLEFSICWDADIGHVREVERIWVAADDRGGIRQVSASPHGVDRVVSGPWEGRPRLAVEPGKHAIYGVDEEPALPRDVIEWMCGASAGSQGVLPWGPGSSFTSPPGLDRQAMRRLREFSFAPTWRHDVEVDLLDIPWTSASELDSILTDHSREWVAASAADPLGWAAGTWDVPGDLVLVRDCRWSGAGWTGHGVSLDSQFARARAQRRRLVLDLRTRDQSGIAELWDLAWKHYCSSMVIIVAQESVAQAASRRGFTAARWVDSLSRPTSGGWVAASTPETVARWSSHALTIGPGPADVSCAFD